MQNKSYEQIEGYVHDFDPKEEYEEWDESFCIGDISFVYGSSTDLGYSTPASKGGVITHDAMYLHVCYVDSEKSSNA